MPKASLRKKKSALATAGTVVATIAATTAAATTGPLVPPGTGLSLVQRALRKLGLVRDIDFALYLPMRYEDETRVVRLADTREGDLAQVEAVVIESEVAFRPRRRSGRQASAHSPAHRPRARECSKHW